MELITEKYKVSDFGILPSAWEVFNINQISVLKARIGWQGLTTAEYLSMGEYFLVTGTDFDDGKIKWETCNFVSKDRFLQDKNIQLKIDDIVITKDGTIGKVGFIDSLPMEATLNSGVFVVRLKSSEFSPLYLYYIFNSKYFDHFLRELVAGSTINHLYQKDFVHFSFPSPSNVPEQTAIATTLRDTDALINSLEKLIEKKRAMREVAIRTLLTGNKRLDGFKGEWKEKLFPEVCWYQEGPGLRNWQFTTDGIKVINVTNLEDDYLNLDRTSRFISWYEFDKMYKHFEINSGDIVVASSGNSYAKVAVVRDQDLPLVMNTSVIRFKPLKNLYYYFLLAFLKSKFFKDQIDLMITGGAQPNFGPFHLNRILIKVPPTMDEQQQIADILRDIDMEIEELRCKSSKYKLIKQGMMQNLLTGKIRLV